MSINKQDQLHLLIRSLGKGEKRHFKVYSRKHVIGKENTYVALFNAIEKQSEYDEQALKRNPLFRDYAPLKNRLCRSLLKSLEVYHASPGIEIRSLLNQLEILHSKSLFELCKRQIRKIKKSVVPGEILEQWLDVLKWELQIAAKNQDMPSRTQVLEEEKRAIILLNNQTQYSNLAHQFSLHYQKLGSKEVRQVSIEMEKLLRVELMKDEKLALTFMAKQYYYDCYFQYYLLQEDYRNSFYIARKKVDLYLNRPMFIDLHPSHFLNTVNGFLVACTGMGNHRDMLIHLSKLKALSSHLKSPADKAQAFYYSYHLLNYYINTGKFSEAELALKQIETELPFHIKALNRLQKIILYTTIAHIYFGLQKYKKASLWLNRSMLLGEEKVRTDIECFVRLFFLIVHVEMKSEPAYLNSLFRGTYRFLKKNKRLFEFEEVFMLFMKQNLNEWNQSSLSEIKNKLSRIEKSATEKHAQNYFDFSSWIESKVENKPFATIVRRKSKAD